MPNSRVAFVFSNSSLLSAIYTHSVIQESVGFTVLWCFRTSTLRQQLEAGTSDQSEPSSPDGAAWEVRGRRSGHFVFSRIFCLSFIAALNPDDPLKTQKVVSGVVSWVVLTTWVYHVSEKTDVWVSSWTQKQQLTKRTLRNNLSQGFFSLV